DEDVLQAAALLDRDERGRASFLVMDRITTGVLPSERPDSLMRYIDTREARFRDVALLLLGNTVLADSLEEAIRLSRQEPRVHFVTRDGQWVQRGTIVHAGAADTPPSAFSGRLERREQLEQVRRDLSIADADLEHARCAAEEAKQRLEAVSLDADREVLRNAERKLAESEKEEARASYEVETARRRSADFDTRLGDIALELTALRQNIDQERSTLSTLEQEIERLAHRRTEAEKVLETAESSAREVSRQYNEAHVAAIQARNRYDNLVRDADRIRAALQSIEERRTERLRQQGVLEMRITQWQDEADAARERLTELSGSEEPRQQAVRDALKDVDDTRKRLTEIEQRLKAVRHAREEHMRRENALAVSHAEVSTRLEDLVRSVQDDFELDLATDRLAVEEIEEEEARHEVTELRSRIRSLGAVNELALESYEAEKERLSFLEEQQRDLESAEQTLLETIKELNTTAANRFQETFGAIQQSFSRLFKDLFGEDASAELVLEDSSDPLESAIEITARPRGKRPSTIAQLSGGEKTLTAIALLFAIYLVKPSPFCILDEVDAPLDDANVERFMQLIRSFSRDTQFILVTHNKRTMEAADRLYGITMQEQGVSKLVGVRFEEAAAMVD
ncbi:MAG: AAA family ATPase, partial [Bacteroidota bacterium]